MMKTPAQTPVETTGERTGERTTTATRAPVETTGERARAPVKNTCRSRALVRFWFGARPTGAARYHAKTAQMLVGVPVGVPVFDGRSLEWRWRQWCLLKRGARRGRVPPRFPVGC